MFLQVSIAVLDLLLHVNEFVGCHNEQLDISEDGCFVISNLLDSFNLIILFPKLVGVKRFCNFFLLKDVLATFMLCPVMFAKVAVAFVVDHRASLHGFADIACASFVAD